MGLWVFAFLKKPQLLSRAERKKLLGRCPPDANAPFRHDYNSAGNLIELEPLKRDSSKLQVSAAALFLCPQQDDTGVVSGRMPAQIGEPFVGCNQPTLFTLDAWPEVIIGYSLPALLRHRRRVVTPSSHQIGNLPGQILIDLNARVH